MNNLQLVTYLKVPHDWALFEKLHIAGHHLIFVYKMKNVFDFGIDMKMLYSNLIWNCLDHIWYEFDSKWI